MTEKMTRFLFKFIAEKHSGCQALTADMAKQYIEGKQLLNLFGQLMSAHLDAARAHAHHHHQDHHNRARLAFHTLDATKFTGL